MCGEECNYLKVTIGTLSTRYGTVRYGMEIRSEESESVSREGAERPRGWNWPEWERIEQELGSRSTP
jgi:hypothetical protein